MQPLPPPRPRKSNAKVIVGVLGGLLLLCGVGAGAVGWLVYAEMNAPSVALSPAERALLITFEDLTAHYELEKNEAVEKTRLGGLFGSRELEYEYDDSGGGGIYLLSSVTLEPTVREARESFVAMKVGLGVVLAVGSEGVKRVERDDLFKWGDDSSHFLLESGGAAVGNIFVGRKGRHVYFLSLGGAVFDDEESLEALLREKLDRAAGWMPASR